MAQVTADKYIQVEINPNTKCPSYIVECMNTLECYVIENKTPNFDMTRVQKLKSRIKLLSAIGNFLN